MKNLITIFAILMTVSVNAQWSFNTTSGTGIESPTNTASGDRSTAMGGNTLASGFASTAMGSGTAASGDVSTAMGNSTIASGHNSTAMGSSTTASGQYSTAMGKQTLASGTSSAAMGDSTASIGQYSTTMGNFTTASDYGTLVIGSYNTDDATPNPTTFSLANTAFVIGNGNPNTGVRSDAMTVLFDGTTTISGSVTATSFIGDGSGLTNVPSILSFNTTSGTGIESPTNTATGDISTAMGTNTQASGFVSTSMGHTTTASGDVSTAMGSSTTASGHNSTAMGSSTTASGQYSTAMGKQTLASGTSSAAMGDSTAAVGQYSTTMGNFTTASDYGTLVIGSYNTDDATPNPTTFSLANTAFVIGNGNPNTGVRSDAMTVLFDGTTTIAGDLTINSDARLKSNIISLGSTLAKLLALDGKSYTFKTDESKQKIGLLAQDVQEVFPELVKEGQDEKGILSVNYQGLIPVLINAIKEQQTTINHQQTAFEKQQSEIELLKQQVKAMQKD